MSTPREEKPCPRCGEELDCIDNHVFIFVYDNEKEDETKLFDVYLCNACAYEFQNGWLGKRNADLSNDRCAHCQKPGDKNTPVWKEVMSSAGMDGPDDDVGAVTADDVICGDCSSLAMLWLQGKDDAARV